MLAVILGFLLFICEASPRAAGLLAVRFCGLRFFSTAIFWIAGRRSLRPRNVRRVDRFSGLVGREVGNVIERSLVAADELPAGAVVAAVAGWLDAISVQVDSDGAQALVTFRVDLTKVAVMGSDALAAND